MRNLIIAAALVVVAGPALAETTVPAANYYVHFEGQNQQDANVGSYAAGGQSVAFGLARSPSIHLSDVGSGAVTAGMSYYFIINGPSNGLIPIIAQGQITVSSSAPDDGQANAQGDLSLITAFNSPSAFKASEAGGVNNNGAGSISPTLNAFTAAGYLNQIKMIASFNGGDGTGIAKGTVFVDPIISIDPVFAAIDPDYLKHYTITFSDGAGNSLASGEGGGSMGGVPEPATWGLMILGFGLIGATLRRRRFALA